MRKLTSSLLAGVLGFSMIAGVAAQTGDAVVCVSPLTGEGAGSINVGISGAQFEDVVYSPNDPTIRSEDIEVTVSDDRGVVGGWTVTLSGTDFVTNPATRSFDSEALNLTAAAAPSTAPGGFVTSGGNVPTTGASGVTPIVIITATGVGTSPAEGYVFTSAASTLTVPAGTLVGEYESTLLVTLTADVVVDPCVVPEVVQPNQVGVVRNV